MSTQVKNISKLMSLVLRHQPEYIGLTLNANGWASVEELINRMNSHGIAVNKTLLEEVVVTNNKQRFAFNEDKTLIRGSQGHSIAVDLELKESLPPDILYHGSTVSSVELIMLTGIKKQSRQHVHLSQDTNTAQQVGARHGKPVVLQVNAKAMYDQGYRFYISANKVWLTDEVPPQFISLKNASEK
ncbi:RNA 2'-phosphotransferase [Foetidibacter luteolus]|uniref:RNA 2'-phosphotransferase n=1 Tax=Foetidibacter luteolus TaxID=2608880 RepID=UPI00129BFBD5|nr:RNA 2'-phosphotransferase [Foetidibacter luteolus]